ncbi:MAG: hypothetical protein DCF15_08575 [Phormidesmis priestleyi]|uniref:Uncharacterized protein n=1 Tax=Phormidesmis priestleyi TaxID=268141 RepID=A0A2W4XGV2_9CYAN|nr:MAG: hypothetical protein DCF15_08575 [Phormidesmis priestleyi]
MIRSTLPANCPFNRPSNQRLIRNVFYGLLLLGLLTPGLSGCFFRGEQNSETAIAPDQPIPNRSALENPNTGTRITVPSGWTVSGSVQRGSADIYTTFQNKLYTMVVSENATGINRFGLEDNSETYRWLIRKRLDTLESETRTGIDSIGGDKAIQYEIRGIVDGVPVVYLHTTIEGIDKYYQVVSWTTAERYADDKETLQTITQSFQET